MFIVATLLSPILFFSGAAVTGHSAFRAPFPAAPLKNRSLDGLTIPINMAPLRGLRWRKRALLDNYCLT